MAAGGMKEGPRRPVIPGWAIGIALILVVLTGCFIAYRWFESHSPEVESDGTAVARVVVSRFEKLGDLRVSRISGTVQGVGSTPGLGGMLPTTYVMKAPFEAGYFVDLSTLDRRKIRWDEKERTLIVTVPDVRLDNVQVDESRKSVDQTGGMWVSRNAMTMMRRQASVGAHGAARTEADKPEWLLAARNNGRTQLRNLFAQPLRIAGIDADVQVRYEGEPVANDEQMDRSRSIAEILSGR